MLNKPYIGEIKMFAGESAPEGWASCEGQLLSIAKHKALFDVLGTTYGGDGRDTFGLPDLRGRAPMHRGLGHNIGESGAVGFETEVRVFQLGRTATPLAGKTTFQPGTDRCPQTCVTC